MTTAVARHKTALSRSRMSRPLAQAIDDELLSEGMTVFDYGCGRGDDLRHLRALGVRGDGWDPTFRPAAPLLKGDLVNLGYVINVIERPEERIDTLRRAWSLSRRVLVVSARLVWDQRDTVGRPLGDGIVTRAGTFQKFYDQSELSAWIEQWIGVPPIAAAPGVFYVFREAADAQQFLANRVMRYRPRVQIDANAMYDTHRVVLQPVVDFLADHGRLPRDDELSESDDAALAEALGSLGRARQLIRKVTPDDKLQAIGAARRADLLVYIGLSRFGRRPRLSSLPVTLARDIKAQFGSYQAACAAADRLLFAAGRPDAIGLTARAAAVGKLTPQALYVHNSGVSELPALLRLYEGCAQVLSGAVEGANIMKLSTVEPQVSYLAYPGFDREAHPALVAAVTVNLRRLTVNFRDYSAARNPPILHRKEEFVSSEHPQRQHWARLTAAEVKAGLYDATERIGTREGWEQVLAERGRVVRGHRLLRDRIQQT